MKKDEFEKEVPATTATSATRAGNKLPEIDTEILKALASQHQDNPDEAFVMRMFFFASSLLDEKDLPQTAVALEMLQAVFSAFEGGLSHADIADGYPDKAWREDTVEIPREWVRELVSGWANYKDGPQEQDFGEALGIDGRGQGKRPVRSRLNARSKKMRLQNLAVTEYLAASLVETKPSWNAAITKTAEAEGVSTDTVKKALNAGRSRIISALKHLMVLD